MIKAIETVYNGYKFRSRLEARWAVFFDKLGVIYEYEPEGFDLGKNLGLYLPDFWLPKIGCWIEIKGIKPTDIELEKIRKLSSETKKPAIIFWGLPGENYGMSYLIDICDSSGGEMWNDNIEWAEDRNEDESNEIDILFDGCRIMFFMPGSQRSDRDYFVEGWKDLILADCFNVKTGHDKQKIVTNTPLITAAMLEAKQSRFEHRETPCQK